MAVPTTTLASARIPAGIKLKDGYQALIISNRVPTLKFWEKTVQPPAIEGGEPIDQTTMLNTSVRTKAPRRLKELKTVTAKVAYDPDVFNTALAEINVEGSWTIYWADGSKVDFFGYLQSIEPETLEEGKQPEATVKIVPTNFDPVAKVEALPVFTCIAGT